MINNNKFKLSLKNKLQGNKWYNIDARKNYRILCNPTYTILTNHKAFPSPSIHDDERNIRIFNMNYIYKHKGMEPETTKTSAFKCLSISRDPRLVLSLHLTLFGRMKLLNCCTTGKTTPKQ